MENRTYTERLDHRPGSQSKGVLNEDLGSSFDLPKRPFPGMAILDSEDDDDELDGLSKKKKKDAPSSPSTMPRVHRDTDDVIRGMKFNKIKKADTDTESPIPTLKENARRDTDKKFTSTVAIHERKNAVASSSTDPRRDKASNRLRSPEGARAKRTAHLMQQRNGTDGSSAKPQRPKPRAVVKQAKAPPMSTQSPSTPKPKPPSRDVATSAKSKGKEKERPANRFPALSPLGDAGGSVNGKERPAKASRAYPGPSPLSSPAKAPTRFPLPSPLSTPTRNRNGQPLVATRYPVPSPLRPEVEGRRKTKRAEPRPFPMNTQLSELSPGPSKRRSPASDSDEERDRKRYKNQPALLPESYDYEEDSELLFISPGTDPKTLCPYCDTPLPPQPTPLLARLLDQTFNKSYRDVRPSNPLGRKAPMGVFVAVCQRHRFESETLPEAEERGWPKCIDWAGLKGRVLKMKRDLSHILTDPGDPIVYRNDDEKEKTQDDETKPHRSKGPRMRCIFWKDLLKDLKNNGTKGVKGVQGQFANFEKTQPGYYGELGSVIIHQALYNMFPLTTIDSALVNPLTPNEFVQRILVPEVGMRLVIQDMDLNVDDRADKKRAVAVLRESASYGVAMFPEDGGEWAGASGKKNDTDEEAMGVADLMVMERARKRRKELEIEEREEDEIWRLQQEKEEAEKKRQKAEIVKEKRRAARKGKEKDVDCVVVDQTTTTRPRPRPVPKNKAKAVLSVDSTDGMDTDSSSDPRRSNTNSDIDMPTSQNSVSKNPGPTPKPRSRHVDKKTYDSDNSDAIEFVSPVQRVKSRSRSTRTTPASSDSERPESESNMFGVETYPRPRSPSISVTDSRRSVRGSSVVDLCSSSEGVSDDNGARSRKRSPTKSGRTTAATAVARRKPTRHPTSSEEDDEAEATPRAKGPPARKTSHSSTGVGAASSSTFVPLDAARRRAPIAKGKRSTLHKATPGWLRSMAEDLCDEDEKSDPIGSEKSHSWLLDDVSSQR